MLPRAPQCMKIVPLLILKGDSALGERALPRGDCTRGTDQQAVTVPRP